MDADHVEVRKVDSGESSKTDDSAGSGNGKLGNNNELESVNDEIHGKNSHNYNHGIDLGGNNSKDNFFCYAFGNLKSGDKAGLKRFKKVDRKGRAQSNSPQERSRPKKRARGDDPFGLNAMLGIEDSNSGPSKEGPNISAEESPAFEAFLTPDLNKQPQQVASKHTIQNAEEGRLGEEVANTMELGRRLGVENIGDFQQQVRESISIEGFQSVLS
ncbi:hypothetical protein Hanom_Chr13g01242701 [Helianthus anomalus]